MLLFTRLILAHVLGDFVLQPSRWVQHKRTHHFKSPYLYLHGLVHGVLIYFLIFTFTYQPWWIVLIIALSHMVIDGFKNLLADRFNPRFSFLIDQVLHLLVILFCVGEYYMALPFDFIFNNWDHWLLALVLLTFVSSRVIQIIMSKWSLPEDEPEASLSKAGSYIGILERLFVFGFILLNQWSVIGLLIAAKSVFRFSDLSRAKDRKLTEYILIGTLLSFGLAILIGIGFKYAQNSLPY